MRHGRSNACSDRSRNRTKELETLIWGETRRRFDSARRVEATEEFGFNVNVDAAAAAAATRVRMQGTYSSGV
jgi:hypothetical protein